MLDFGCEAIVVACNTATVMALGELRREWPKVPFVGTVPAVRPASLLTPAHSTIVVLATKNTVESAALQNLLQPYQFQTNFELVGTTDLVRYIEAADWQTAQREVESLLAPYASATGVVLGCTHFPLVAAEIQQAIGSPVPFFFPNEGVSNRLQTFAPDLGGQGSLQLFSSDGQKLETLWQALQPRLQIMADFATLHSR